ncbi:MAG: hypothetical protein M5R36_14050 [Deltaproteobacteria bacterium]|nr:hypothetical protein [Deltaproteobacteria bacterium]
MSLDFIWRVLTSSPADTLAAFPPDAAIVTFLKADARVPAIERHLLADPGMGADLFR